MIIYNIEIEELLQRVVNIEAENKEEALRLVKEKYNDEDIVLDYKDFVNVNFRNA